MSGDVAVTPSSTASFAWSFESMTRSSVIAANFVRCWAMVCCCAVPCASVRCPARTAVEIRLSASLRRQASTFNLSLNASFEMDSPFTLPTGAR